VSPRSAKTHKGAWALFGELFVEPGRVDRTLSDAANRARELREESDYQAAGATPEEAEETVAAAERFVNAIDDLFD
jgi:uncharacterized protein (UPF0332 family)